MNSRQFLILVLLFQMMSIFPVIGQQATRWLKGNLHTHSYWSDGDDFPEMIMDWYKSHGYDFVALSDHNILAEGEKWKLIPDHEHNLHGFEHYLEKYGEDWVVYETDSAQRIQVKLKTLEEYRPFFEEQDKFLIIQSEEISDGFNGKPIHINATNIKELITPQGGNSVAEVMQNNIDKVLEQRKNTGQPMFPHINHPNFQWAISVEDMKQLEGERFFEVYNGHPLVHNEGDSLRPGMEQLWDLLLTYYILQGKPLLYGLATDDAHNYHVHSSNHSNPGRGWVMVRATELSPDAIIQAMEMGDFYSTTGVELEDFSFRNNKLKIKVKPEPGVNFTIQFWGGKKIENTAGVLLKEMTGTNGNYKMKKSDLYVRAKVISSKLKENPYKENDLETAWSQPVVRK
ncbi:hypothetical protein BH23BAC1_BH23BAC1_49240 [soil metagenome]